MNLFFLLAPCSLLLADYIVPMVAKTKKKVKEEPLIEEPPIAEPLVEAPMADEVKEGSKKPHILMVSAECYPAAKSVGSLML